MQNEDKVCCWLSWNIFTRVVIFIIIMGIPFHIYSFEQITIFQLFSGFGALIGLFILHLRNIEMGKQTKVQYETFNGNRQFQNFLEATKMLTDKDSTNEAKISALYLLYDVAKNHPENIDRIIQVINKELLALINYIEGNKENICLNLGSINQKKEIIEWVYKGNKTEKMITNSLFIIKKMVLLDSKNNSDLSNSIIFDLDQKYDKDIKYLLNKLTYKNEPMKNLIFLHCNLDNLIFVNVVFHYCKFINCSLNNTSFEKASNLWGTVFENCKLKNTNFKDIECEGVEFKECFSLETKQIENMKFKNFDNKDKKFLIIYNDKNNDINCFKTEDEYKEWKKFLRTK